MDPGLLPATTKSGLGRDRGGDLGTEGFETRLGLVSSQVFQSAGQDKGQTLQTSALFLHVHLQNLDAAFQETIEDVSIPGLAKEVDYLLGHPGTHTVHFDQLFQVRPTQ